MGYRMNRINQLRMADSSPEKAGVGGSIPSLATMFSNPYGPPFRSFIPKPRRTGCVSTRVNCARKVRSWLSIPPIRRSSSRDRALLVLEISAVLAAGDNLLQVGMAPAGEFILYGLSVLPDRLVYQWLEAERPTLWNGRTARF
jgi:hypothetical protein